MKHGVNITVSKELLQHLTEAQEVDYVLKSLGEELSKRILTYYKSQVRERTPPLGYAEFFLKLFIYTEKQQNEIIRELRKHLSKAEAKAFIEHLEEL